MIDGTMVDIQATGFWRDQKRRAFFDVKERAYEERIREVEHGSFTPLIFSTQGSMGKEATTMYKRLASLLSSKRSEPYSRMINWIRCRIGFLIM